MPSSVIRQQPCKLTHRRPRQLDRALSAPSAILSQLESVIDCKLQQFAVKTAMPASVMFRQLLRFRNCSEQHIDSADRPSSVIKLQFSRLIEFNDELLASADKQLSEILLQFIRLIDES